MKEYHANFQSVTDHLTLNAQEPLHFVNIFKNIKSLDIMDRPYFFEKITQKINLPKLESLKVRNTMQLVHFTGLKLLKSICI